MIATDQLTTDDDEDPAMIATDQLIADDDNDDEKNPNIENESGIEDEEDDPEQPIDTPFKPEEVKIQTVHVVVQQLIYRIEYDEIDLSPDFQRLRGIWDSIRKSRLIESLLLRIPIPVFYVAADNNEKWKVVDGVQRISTIHNYIDNNHKLKGLEYLTQFNGKTYDQLPRSMQRRISETQLVVNVISPETPEEVMFNIFSRINTGGLQLNSQELIHAMHKDPARGYLKDLADSNEFKQATNNSICKDRMADRECVLRFLTFYISPWEKYKASSFQSYFFETMKKLNQMNDDQRDQITRDFNKSMQAAFAIFGKKAFRKHNINPKRTNPINRSLFEIWSVPLARYSEHHINTLISNKKILYERFITLCKDPEFEKSIAISTGTTQRVRKRFGAITKLLAEFI